MLARESELARSKKRLPAEVALLVLFAVVTAGIIAACRSAAEAPPVLGSQPRSKAKPEGQKREQGPANEAETSKRADPNDPNWPGRPLHRHKAFKERVKDRQSMVALQIELREVKDPNVLRAMRTVPRHAFVGRSEQRWAYYDHPLPIAENQTISQPYIVAFMTEALRLRPGDRVLEIGTGSGYQAAVCAEIAREVYTIEIVEPLAKSAKKLLKELGYPNVFVRAGDGYFGWPEKAPFDAIIGTAAAERLPKPLIEQLKPGGRMILPCGDEWGLQYLVLITKDRKGRTQQKKVMPVRFVPMTGEVQRPEEKARK